MDFNLFYRNPVKTLLLIITFVMPRIAVRAGAADADAVTNSVVKVFSTVRYPRSVQTLDQGCSE